MKALSHTYTCIHSPPNSPPIQAATWHGAEVPELSGRSLLVLQFKHSSVSMSIPNSLTIPSSILPPGDYKVITEDWADVPVLDSRSLLVLRVKYSTVSMSIPNSLPIPSPILLPWQPYVHLLSLWVCFWRQNFKHIPPSLAVQHRIWTVTFRWCSYGWA